MRYNKLIILGIFLIAILSIGVASAANQTDDSTNAVELSDVDDSTLESEDIEVLTSSNQTVTPQNFFDYFDESGDSKTNDDLVFEGEFNRPVDHITISSSRNIYGENAVFRNMGITIRADDVTISGLTLNSNQYVENEEGALIYASESGITLQNIVLNYTPENGNNVYGIFFDDCENFKLVDSQINFEATNPGEFYEYGIKMVDCTQSLIQGNLINVTLPIVTPEFYGKTGLDQDYVLGIGIGSCEEIIVRDNDIFANVNLYQYYATLSAIMVFDSSDISFISNNISETDFITPQNSPNCLYAFNLDSNRNHVLIEKNNISVRTNGGDNEAGTAYGLQGMFSDVKVIGNNITCVSNGPNIGIYVTSLGGGNSQEYIADNFINVTGFASTTGSWALVTGIEIQIGSAKIYNNTIRTHNVGLYEEGVFCYGVSYSQWIAGERSFDIQDNTIITNGKYTISTIATESTESTPVFIKNNDLRAHDLLGNDSIQLCGNSIFPDDNETGNESGENVTYDMRIDVGNVWINNDNLVKVTIPNATGSVTVSINGKTYSANLINGVATKTLPASDLISGENLLTATYGGLQNSSTFKVLNGVIDKNNVFDYFNKNNGALDDCVPEGATLDFQGEIKATEIGNFNITINKAVNIVSSTHDAFIDLNTTAGDRQGTKPGDKFTINKLGSKTNVTGVTFHNTQLWIANANRVTLERVSVIIENQNVGWGVGATSIRENSSYITVKNCNFHTINSGGASTLVIAWANYCNLDNNTVVAEGDIGNTIYITTYNVVIPDGAIANIHNNVTNNVVRISAMSPAICWGITFSGSNNLIENNTVIYSGIGISSQSGLSDSSDNIFKNNNLSGGASMSVLPNSLVEGNYISGGLTLPANVIAYNNTVLKGLTIAGNNVNTYNNSIKGSVNINAIVNAQIRNSNITGDILIAKNGENNIICENNIIGTVTIKGPNNVVTNNYIASSGDYAVVITDNKAKDNNITYNYLYSIQRYGNDAVNDKYKYNFVMDNLPETTNLTVVVESIKVGQTATVRIWVNVNATGSVKVKFKGVEYPVTISNGFGTFDIADLAAGTYTVDVIFSGDDTYAAKTETKSFTVSKYDISIDDKISVDVPDRGNPSFTVDLGSDVTGNVTVTIINSYTETLVNGRATVTVTDLQAGSYHATITYSGDGKYNSNSAYRDFIIKAEPAINVTVNDINVGEDAYVNVSADSRISSVKIVLNGEHILNLADGKGILPVSGLSHGNYTVYVVFSGNSELLNKTVNTTFKVSKIDVVQDAISMENDFKAPKFTISLSSDATGRLTVTINGNDYSADVIAGNATVLVENLSPNSYSATVTYSGDSKYNSVSKDFDFIIKAEPTLTVEVEDIKVGDIAHINITTSAGIDSVILNGQQTVEIVNGKGNASISGLAAGKYTIKVKFNGNGNFFAKEVSANITVSKHEITDDAFSQNGNMFTITLPSDATGNFTVKVGEKPYSSPIIQGKANVTADDLNPGDYDVLMSYTGDGKYTNASKSTTLNVPKWESAVNTSVSDIKVGEDAIFDVEVTAGATGNVDVIINGKKYNGTLVNGKVTITVPNLSNGTYEAIVNYTGDDNYLASSTIKTFNVTKVDIEGIWFSVGESIEIDLPTGATGKVTVHVNGEDIVRDVIGGKATITPELTPGEYPVTITYSGDGKYNGISDASQISIPKYDAPISVSVNEVVVGETVKFTITLPVGTTGNVTVVINGKGYNGTIGNGKAVINVDGLPEGNYTAEIRYPGDNNYSANQTTKEFEVSRYITPDPYKVISIQVADSANPTFSFELENSTGNFTVYVDGKEYGTASLVGGKASIKVSGLSSGKHDATAVYSGDNRFASVSRNATITVPEPHVPVIKLTGSDVNMLYTSGAKYTVRLTSDGSPLSGKTVTFTINGKQATASTDKNGYASVKIDLPPKSTKYTVSAKYQDATASNKVKVNSIMSAKNLNVRKSAKTLKIKVTLKKVNGKYLKSKKLTLKLNGKKYTAKTNKKGVATFKITKKAIKKLKAGKKYTYQANYLKDSIKKSISVKK